MAAISLHTSPLHQPGTGDAGGLNVYVVQSARALAALGVEVEIFTRATEPDLDPVVELAPGITVHHVTAGPTRPLPKEELPGRLCEFAAGMLQVEAVRERAGHYGLVHSHYWLSGQVGRLVSSRWGVPLVHSTHTLAKVKNAGLAPGDQPEPASRVLGEQQVVAAADRLLANTGSEAAQLLGLYAARPEQVRVVEPGADLALFQPGSRALARARLGLPADADVLLFAGRIQPLKAPDVLVRAAALLPEYDPATGRRLLVAVVGGPSGSGLADPTQLRRLAAELGIADRVRFQPPVAQGELADWYRAATLAVVPSRSESFGLVAVEAQACATPVVASRVGGLTTAVRDQVSGVLVDGHRPADYARAIGALLADRDRLRRYGVAAAEHAAGFGWSETARRTLEVYSAVTDERRGPGATRLAACQ